MLNTAKYKLPDSTQ